MPKRARRLMLPLMVGLCLTGLQAVGQEPLYLDISVPPNTRKVLPVDTHSQAFAYVFAGAGKFRDASAPVGVRVEKEEFSSGG